MQISSQPQPQQNLSHNSAALALVSENCLQRNCPFCVFSSNSTPGEIGGGQEESGERPDSGMQRGWAGGTTCQVWKNWSCVGCGHMAVHSPIQWKAHLSRILQGGLVVQVVQVGQEVQFFHNLVSQVGQVILEVLWVRQLSPLLVPVSDAKYFLECIGFTAAGPSSLVATFTKCLPLHCHLDMSL